MTVLLLIAVRYFDLSQWPKSLVATAGSLGLMISPLAVYWVQHRQIAVRRASGLISASGAVLFLLLSLSSNPLWFAFLSVLAMTCSSANIPLISSFHQHFFPPRRRGRLFAWIMMIRIVSVALVSWAAGLLLGLENSPWRVVTLFFALCFAGMAYCFRHYPRHLLDQNEFHSPFSGFRWLREDRLFFWTLVSWMVMGFGNLMMVPLRIEYLSDRESGLWLEPDQVAIITAVVPGVMRLLFVPVWGRIFDSVSLFRLRIGLNFIFALHVLVFFNVRDYWALIISSSLFGIAHSGGDVAWNLWVTRLAPPGRAADYMSVHTFMTGIRGFLAPFAGFWVLQYAGYSQLALWGGGLMMAAGLFILKPAISREDLALELRRESGKPAS